MEGFAVFHLCNVVSLLHLEPSDAYVMRKMSIDNFFLRFISRKFEGKIDVKMII
jgi:hypothetical protein